MTKTFTLEDVLGAHSDRAFESVDVALPGRVESYDPTAQSAVVQPLVKRGRLVADERVVERFPPIHDVPIVFLGSGAYSITWPIKKGDTVLLVISSRSLDRWLHGGGEVDPGDDRRMDVTDAIAIPGLRSFNRALPAGAVSSSDVVISSAGLIRAGGDEPLVTLDQFLNHTHLTAGLGAPTPPTEITPSAPPGFAGTAKLRG